jgi:hypothetical protein
LAEERQWFTDNVVVDQAPFNEDVHLMDAILRQKEYPATYEQVVKVISENRDYVLNGRLKLGQ